MSRILIYDRGAWIPFAQALAADGVEVLYFSEWREVAPSSRSALVGRDVPGVSRVDSFWAHIDEVDAIAFPDIGDGDLQTYLRDKGYPVWGCGKSEMLELDRYEFKNLLKKLGMPIVPTRHVIGLDALKSILVDEDDRYIKTSFFRGDFETFHHITWDVTEPWFRDLQHRLGPHGEEIEILVEDPVKAVEVGYDGFCIDGQFPKQSAWGLELKDSAYIGQATRELPACLATANEAVAEALGKLGMRGCYSSEVRVAEDGTAYLSDPTCRCPSPPIGAMSMWVSNWAEIVLEGANGNLVEPRFVAEYACEIELASPWLEKDWLALEAPAEAIAHLRLRRPTVYGDRWWCVPHDWLDILGSAVGLGPSPEAAIDAALAVAEQVEAIQVSYQKNAREALLNGWREALDACSVQP